MPRLLVKDHNPGLLDRLLPALAARAGKVAYRPPSIQLEELRGGVRLWPPSAKRLIKAIIHRLGFDLRAPYPNDFDHDLRDTIEFVTPYTMTNQERLAALCDATRHLVERDLGGAFVECGVWRGGSMMAAALTLIQLRADDRDLFLFDTFAGMPAPSPFDSKPWLDGPAAHQQWAARQRSNFNEWCYASLEEARANMASTGYDMRRVHLIEGRVEETLPKEAPEAIALLRLDTDWYEATRHALKTLYPRLQSGGILILDDYGEWLGARKAVDEFFAHDACAPLLARVDAACRLAVKP
jgi:O-methyltransferase